MAPATLLLPLLLLACVAPASPSGAGLLVTPDSPVLEIGSNFTATCVIVDAEELTADDLYWNLSRSTVPKERYARLNATALSVTVAVAGERAEWLYCHSRRPTRQGHRRLTHGIRLRKAYPPGRPENLTCVALQAESSQGFTMSCRWEASGRQAAEAPSSYTLSVAVRLGSTFSVSTSETSGSLHMLVYPFHMLLDVWVEARNILGANESQHLLEDAGWFVKPRPPPDFTLISESSFPTSLLGQWKHPIADVYMRLTYQLRFRAEADPGWTNVPAADTSRYMESFRLQKLRPDTLYSVQVRCRNAHDGLHWSHWSTGSAKTPEDRPASRPDVWTFAAEPADPGGDWVLLVAKDPKFSNGKIERFELKVQVLNGSLGVGGWEQVPVQEAAPYGGPGHHLLKKLRLPEQALNISVVAINSVGTSPAAWLVLDRTHELPPVEELEARPAGGRLELRWRPSSRRTASEYVVEWSGGAGRDWQRESRGSTNATVRGNLDPFVSYNISVVPVYSRRVGKARSTQAFVEQGAPLEGPAVAVKDKPGHNKVELVWTEIPAHRRRGFITNYTIFYSSGPHLHNVTVAANTTSYTLSSLSGNTKYDAWVVASTIGGSVRGNPHSFTTLKYAPGQIEAVVVGVCLLFFFLVLMATLLCIYKEDTIKRSLWPRIPNPGDSTIGSWSPDCPLKAETPKDGCVSGVSVLAVEVCEVQCEPEEDKAGPPLKRDQYLSEEHSSGIGGSSCMSSPRHSVSDSDEGSDGADTTASTVQYSSVVAVGGYKGQTPGPKPAAFSRSESTQPLLDSEEPPEAAAHAGGGPAGGALDFEPIPEEGGASADGRGYRPQRSGYRPQ